MDRADIPALKFLVAQNVGGSRTPNDGTWSRLRHEWCCRSEEKGERRKKKKQIWCRLGTLLYIRIPA